MNLCFENGNKCVTNERVPVRIFEVCEVAVREVMGDLFPKKFPVGHRLVGNRSSCSGRFVIL